MSDERDRMIETLKEYVIPVLRERRIQRSFPHFRSPTERTIQLLTFQFDKWGGGFTFEIASCPPDGVTIALFATPGYRLSKVRSIRACPHALQRVRRLTICV